LDELLKPAEIQPQGYMNTFESKGSPEPPPKTQEVKITIKRLRGHKSPGRGLVEVEVRIIAGQQFLRNIHKLILPKLDNEAFP
jgi:hypothetical protein